MIPSRQNAFEYKKTVCFMLMQAQGGNKTKCPPALSTCKDTIGFVNCFVSNRRNRSYPIARPRPRFLRKRPRNEVFSRVTGNPSTLFDILNGKLVHQPSYFVACVAGWIVFSRVRGLAVGSRGPRHPVFSEIVLKLQRIVMKISILRFYRI